MELIPPVTKYPLRDRAGQSHLVHVLTDAGPRVVLTRFQPGTGRTELWILATITEIPLGLMSESELRQEIRSAFGPCLEGWREPPSENPADGIDRQL